MKVTTPQVQIFAQQMEKELATNSHKGDWRTWKDLPEMLWELEYHKAKLLKAINDNDKDMVREYIADCANILMFMGNAGHVYSVSGLEVSTYDITESDKYKGFM